MQTAAYWPNGTDWGVEARYIVEKTRVGTFAIYDADADTHALPLKVFNLRADAVRECRKMNAK